MADYSKMKLGKRHPRHDPRVPMLAKYTATLPSAPLAVEYRSKIVRWPMMLNDQLGDCTCAAVGHVIQQWTTYNDKPTVLSDQQVEQLYQSVGGYNPSDPTTDNGAVEADVLNYWLNNQVVGHPLGAYAALELQNHNEVKDAVYWFGNCYIGLALPLSAQTQDVWAKPPGGAVGPGAPGSWGGHAVPVVAYDGRGLDVITWGAVKRMTWQFWDTYCDEAYALLSTDWTEGKLAPPGFNYEQLSADIQTIKRGFASAKAITHF
jgi:hypothetical protein